MQKTSSYLQIWHYYIELSLTFMYSSYLIVIIVLPARKVTIFGPHIDDRCQPGMCYLNMTSFSSSLKLLNLHQVFMIRSVSPLPYNLALPYLICITMMEGTSPYLIYITMMEGTSPYFTLTWFQFCGTLISFFLDKISHKRFF